MVIFGVFSPILSAPYFLAFSVVLFFFLATSFFLSAFSATTFLLCVIRLCTLRFFLVLRFPPGSSCCLDHHVSLRAQTFVHVFLVFLFLATGFFLLVPPVVSTADRESVAEFNLSFPSIYYLKRRSQFVEWRWNGMVSRYRVIFRKHSWNGVGMQWSRLSIQGDFYGPLENTINLSTFTKCMPIM